MLTGYNSGESKSVYLVLGASVMQPPLPLTMSPSAVCLVIWMSLMSFASAYTETSYTAAVYEHARQGNWSDDTPEYIVQTNLAYYKTAARVARSKGADIIIYAEYGIFIPGDREYLKKFLEFVPDPKTTTTNPCEESELYLKRTILKTLSCIARNNSIVVVANMGDIQPCQGQTGCSDDGDFHFNTNVAFDSDGTLIGRYHKEKLFFESGMDLPKVPQDPTFQTSFGKFGMFVCFDVVFKKITQIAMQGVEGILLPTMWIDPTPLMTSVQLWQAFAMVNNVTFMAANVQMPGYSAVGSGIFNSEGPVAYTYNTDGISKLVVAKVPRRFAPAGACTSESSITAITSNGTEEYKNDGDKVPRLCSSKILGETNDPYTDYRCLEEDTSNYTFVKLNNTEDHIEACNSGLCCSLDYLANNMNENYYLGVYNGTYNMFNRYYWCQENCLLVRCDAFGNNSCATFPMRSETKFLQVRLSMNHTTEYIYPSVLGSGIRLVPRTEWSHGIGQDRAFLTFENTSGKELLVVGLNGRCYERDPPYVR